MSKKVSELFMECFTSGGGGIVRTCECGITWFNYMDRDCFNEGELDDLEKKSEENPAQYKSVDSTVGTYIVSGKEYVIGCECNGGAELEEFIVRHDRWIAQYLNQRAKALKKRAAEIEVKV